MSGNGKFRTENGTGCDAMNPKALMLYAAAQCSAQTALMIMQKERITPKRFEISFSGDLSAETVQSESVYRSFHVVYNVECKIGRRPGEGRPRTGTDTRKVLRHGADAAQDRTRVARNRGGQHRACESLKRQARDTKNGDFHLKSPFFVPRRQETGGGVPKRRSRPCGFRSRNRHPRRDGLPGKACLPPLTAP